MIGTTLGPYQLLSKLGEGGMGQVYRARDVRLDREVAVKILAPQLAGDPQFRERFEREARTIASLNHPQICAIYDVGSTSGSAGTIHYLVMEYLEGRRSRRGCRKGVRLSTICSRGRRRPPTRSRSRMHEDSCTAT